MINQGLSLHIGINQVDPACYGQWEGKLQACESDARAMAMIAKSQGLTNQLLLTQEATRNNVLDKIRQAADQLTPGDLYFLSYAGHGGQVPDTSGDESDGLDETWCLYDGQLLDDELTMAFCDFKEGVRILLISDSCHSGTVSRHNMEAPDVPEIGPDGIGFRCMYPKAALTTYRSNRKFYDQIKTVIPNPLPVPKASIKSITACRDNQSAADGKANGFFTSNLLKVWDNGSFSGDYETFFEKLERKMKWKTFWNGNKQEPVFIKDEPMLDTFREPFRI